MLSPLWALSKEQTDRCSLGLTTCNMAPMRSFLRLSACFAALATLLSVVPSTAFAQGASVYVLGLRSIEGDDEFARELSGVIRVAAGRIPGWEVAPDEVTLSQMTMMHACEEPNRECMGNIASELGAGKIIYGTIVRRGDEGFGLTLYLYDHATANIEDQLTDTIPSGETGMDVLRPRAQRYTAQLGGQARFGSLRLEAGEPGATVRVDNNAVGVTNAAGTILVEDLTEGSHEVEVDAEGFETFNTTLEIEADDQTEVRVNLNASGQGGGSSFGWVPGAALIVGGAIALGIGINSGIKVLRWDGEGEDLRSEDYTIGQIASLSDCVNLAENAETLAGRGNSVTCGDTVYSRHQALILSPGDERDACTIATPGSWQADVCSQQNTAKIIAWVLNTIGAVSVGVGTYLLIRSLGSDDEDDSNVNLSIQPWMAGRDGGVDMTLTW